ncbi:hypothetical protein [Opitutus terrae]|uniref:Uncharacterized protein n=1 Tax=Opitutus terrae (strain DSM 11246 / JCM 15787 / PB90-1) TaxID=452637 RepID=B2A045_OPITP|nr:hypothetical protein [Opitutus terrae]ACB77381.1 hypothetical protein Oter_4107 [Opitutus terrae PB90-1]
MSFSCPHFRINDDYCLRLKTDCVPGRPGCVLGSKAVFAVPVEQRIREAEENRRRRENAQKWGLPDEKPAGSAG